MVQGSAVQVVQGFKRFRGSEVQRFRGSEVQGFRGLCSTLRRFYRGPLLPDDFFLRFAALDVFALHEQIGHVVLVDVAHVGHGLTANLLGRDPFHVVEPDVRIEAARGRLAAQLPAHGPGRSCRRRTRRGPC